MIGKIFKKINHLSTQPYLVFLIFVLLLMSGYIWKLGAYLPLGLSDVSFHLATAQGFARAGGIVVWDFWESLPLGRPHNYPPLFHAIIANFLQLGLSPLNALKLMIEITIVGGFSIYSWGLTKLLNIKVAFWSVLLLALYYHFIGLSALIMPSTLTLFMAPALFFFFRQEKWVSYSIVLIFMFYLHLFMPYFILLSIGVYALFFERKLIIPMLKATAVSFVFYLPWAIHIILGGWEYIKYFDSSYSMKKESLRLNPLITILALIWIVIITKEKFKKLSRPEIYLLSSALIFLCLSLLSTDRFLNGHFLLFLSPIAAMAIIRLWPNIIYRFAVSLLIIFYAFYNICLIYDGVNLKAKLEPSLITMGLKQKSSNSFDDNYISMINLINRGSNPGESIAAAVSYHDKLPTQTYELNLSDFWGANASLSSLNLREPESKYRDMPDLSKSRYIMLGGLINNLEDDYFTKFGYKDSSKLMQEIKKNFSMLAYYNTGDGTQIYFYRNNTQDITKEKLPTRKFPLWLVDIILMTFIGLLILDLNKIKRRPKI